MSWTVEQSEGAQAAVTVDGASVVCRKEGYYGSPINLLWNDPAEAQGQYYWQIEFSELDNEGNVSAGLTVKEHFKAGYQVKAMEYNGNLADGSCLLVGSFGDRLKQGDKLGILLNLTSSEMKVHLFVNDKSLGLAFHLKGSYPKPLYPIVSFQGNGRATISRSQNIPSNLDRHVEQFQGIEGHWKLAQFPQHSDCAGYKFAISKQEAVDGSQDQYSLHTSVINSMNSTLSYNSSTGEAKTCSGMMTLMGGDPESMRKENVIQGLVGGINKIQVQDNDHLHITSDGNGEVVLERYTPNNPQPHTKNVFSKDD